MPRLFRFCRTQLVLLLTLCGWVLLPALGLADGLAPGARLVSASASNSALAKDIRDRIESPGALSVRGQTLDRGLLATVYGQRDFAPLWSDHPEWPAALMAEVTKSEQDSMPADNFNIAALRAAIGDPAFDAADRDLLLTDRFLAYGAEMAHGRIAIGAIDTDWILPTPVFNPVAAVGDLAKDGGPAAVLDALKPASADYDGLRAALGRYLAFAAAGGWESLPATARIDMGDKGQLVTGLRRRLAAEGYLRVDQSRGETFDRGLAEAVATFQSHHGLSTDSRIGPMTVAALNVSVADRIEQIRLNLERWRAMPRFWPETRIEVAVPAQTLVYYRNGKAVLMSRVIVGDPRHPTPVLAAAIERIVLDPPWDVPSSIIAQEIEPRLRGDPDYLAHHHMIILGRGNGDPYGQDVDWQHTSVLSMGWRLRQLPGPWNALGTVMFDMPNPFDVYLHDTPARALFAAPVRALSHGCVRVEEARSLGALLIAVASLPAPGGETSALPLAAPVPVYLLYQTAFVDPDGSVEFRDDVYGRDRRLAAALAGVDHAAAISATSAAKDGRGCPGITRGLPG